MQDLPRLPVPDLWLTVSRYLASLKAVLAPTGTDPASGSQVARSERTNSKAKQYKRTDQLVRQFMLHEGPQLQRDLKEYANKCQNWVSREANEKGMKLDGRTARQIGRKSRVERNSRGRCEQLVAN